MALCSSVRPRWQRWQRWQTFIHIASNQIELCHVVRVQKTCVVISSASSMSFQIFFRFEVTSSVRVPGRSSNCWAWQMETGEVVVITTMWPGQMSTSSAGNTSSYSPQLWARCPTCSSSRQLCPHLWCLGLGMTKAEWLQKDSWEDSMRIWRKTNAERQALRGCCGGLVDRKVHSKKVHSQRMETFKMEWRSYANMKKIF